MKNSIVLAAVMLLVGSLPAMATGRFITKITLPAGPTVVVAEGEFEARSIGSFSVRLYQAASAGNETTFFSSGLISGRDGTIEKVVLENISGDEQPEIIVILRSVGTGNYLSAHAFEIGPNQRLIAVTRVEGLAAEADPVKALRQSATQ
jgi:hypothetical protein